ncbi:MAG: hypothetical protein VB062_04765 [Christensenella sp.]|nr:hypothetical protein [Christensenella sp.]
MTIVFTKHKRVIGKNGRPATRTEVKEFAFGSTKKQQRERMAIADHYNKRASDAYRYADTVTHYVPFNGDPGGMF